MKTIKSAIDIFKKYPILLTPLFITWIIIASGVIYFKWHFPWNNYSTNEQIFYAYIFYLIASCTIIFSCSFLVELIEQDEHGNKMNLLKAIRDSLRKNIFQLIILSFIWSITWFFLVMLKVLLSKKKNNGSEEESAENIARTLAGSESFSWSTFTIDMLIKALRMIMFVIIPAFAWENKNIFKSFKRGISIISTRTSNFIDNFVVSLGVQFVLYLPPTIMFYMSGKLEIQFNDFWWYLCIVYIGFAWSFTLYIEQLFGAELFLWQMKYENECAIAIHNNQPIPKFHNTEKPFLLDEINDLENISTTKPNNTLEKESEPKEKENIYISERKEESKSSKPKSRTEKMKIAFLKKNDEELIYIIENKGKYQEIAVEIAKTIMDERNVG